MKYLVAGLLLFITAGANAQEKTLYEKQWFMMGGDTLPYRIMLPENFDPSKTYPVIFFLHGRGESGNDNERQLANISSFFTRDSIRKHYPAIVIFPQCAADKYWSNVNTVVSGTQQNPRSFYFIPGGPPSVPMQLLLSFVDNIFERFPVNKQQVYVAGLSMGGMGTFELVRRKPHTFAAAIAICGGAHPATAAQMKQTAFWIFHGLKDDVVPPQKSQAIAAALKKTGADVKLTLFPEANHNSWDAAFAEPGLMRWLFSKRLAR